ncbi:MAG: M14 family zinc carboxypeptidase, partial [candidate division WOR-3 bacterium]
MVLLLLTAISPLWHDYNAASAKICSLAQAYPTICHFETLGFSQLEQRPIVGIRISDNPTVQEDEPRVLFNGVHHGREVIGCEICLFTAESLLRAYAVDPAIKRLVDSVQTWIVPVVNPDGHQENFTRPDTYKFWRKNKRDNNSNGQFDWDYDGVDLNRNYPYYWEVGSSNPADKYYRGPSPFSESECVTMANLALREDFVFAINWHSDSGGTVGEVMYYPATYKSTNIPDYPFIKDVSDSLGKKIKRQSGSGTYSPSATSVTYCGMFRNYLYHDLGTFSWEIEVSYWNYPADTLILPVSRNTTCGAIYLMQRALGPAIYGRVFDSTTGLPLPARVQILGYDASGDTMSPRYCDSLFGRFRRIVKPGSYPVRVSLAGYRTKTCTVAVVAGRPSSIDLYLVPENVNRDVGCFRIVAPSDAVDSGFTLTPACSVANFGASTESYAVRMRIGAAYNFTASVNGHSPGTQVYLTFPAWSAQARGTYTLSCSTELAGDIQPGNDRQTGLITIQVLDVGPVGPIWPAGLVDSGSVVVPGCSVVNFGTVLPGPYPVRLKIGSIYNRVCTLAGHNPGTSIYLTFPACTLKVKTTYAVRCSTEL